MVKFVALITCYLLPLFVVSQNPGNLLTPDSLKKEDTLGQTDLIDVFLKATGMKVKSQARVKGKKVYYSLLPVGRLPTGGTALVTTTKAGFYLGSRKTTYMSNITFSPSTNFKGQFSIPFEANIWSSGNAWNYQGQLRYSYFPLDTWGIGGRNERDEKLRINYSYIRLYGSALKKIKPYLFTGFGFNLDYHISIKPADDTSNISKFTNYEFGTQNNSNSVSSGFTYSLLFDTRVNSVNPLPGFYTNFTFRSNPDFLCSDGGWSSVYIDARKYVPLTNKGQNMIAIWSYVWGVLGRSTPYLNLPAIGWDAEQKSGRGIYSRRYTGNTLIYLEAEYRKDITSNGLFGFVVFANVNSVTEPNTRRFVYWHPAAGTGLRIKFNKKSATNICIDVGFSKGHTGFYLGLGEAF